MKLIQTIAAGALLLGMGSAFAEEPVALTDAQMDNVNAGAVYAQSTADASALIGEVNTYTEASAFDGFFFQAATTSSQASASGILVSASSTSTAYTY